MKKKLILAAVTGVALVTALVILRPTRGTPGAPPAAAAKSREAPAAPVRTLVLQAQPLDESLVATGTVRADESVDLRPEVSGRLTRIHFQEGAAVRAGELLVSLDDSELRASLQRAAYRRDLAALKTNRLARLRDQGGVTEQDHDIAASELNVLTAEVAVIEAQLAHTRIRAPFDGVIGLRSVSEGAYVTPATRIATFQRLDRLKVDFSVPEKYLGRLSPARELTIELAGAGPPLVGRIHAIDPLIDPATRMALVRAGFANPAGRYLSGGFATVRLVLDRTPDALLVPASALVPGAQGASVFVVKDGKAVRRQVRTRVRTDTAVEVIDGLRPNETIVVSGHGQLRNGQEVQAQTEGAPAARTTPAGLAALP